MGQGVVVGQLVLTDGLMLQSHAPTSKLRHGRTQICVKGRCDPPSFEPWGNLNTSDRLF